ncbi:MAG TPA: PAS domain S-box protein [Flavobacteriales bacterium]|nr:PAS domain S-box protein [Flavobacteriales bacterium]
MSESENDIKQVLINERESRIRAESDLKKAERRIHELEKKFATALNASRILKSNVTYSTPGRKRTETKGFDFDGDGIWHLDVKNRIASFSPGFCRKFGIESEELNDVISQLRLIGTSEGNSMIVELVNSDDHLENSIQNTCKLMTVDGDYRWVLEKAQIIERDSQGVPVLIFGETIDITYQKEIEEQFKIIARRFSGLLENIQMGVLVEDENRDIALVNQTFCQLFHIPGSPEKIVGMNCVATASDTAQLFNDPDLFIHRIDELLEARELVVNEELILTDGRVFERDYIPIFIDDEYRGNLWKYRDITERKSQENKLKIREEKYRSIIENMNLGILEVDLDEKIQYANQSFCRMSGFELKDLVGQNASDLFINHSQDELISDKIELRQKGISDAYELPVKTHNGEEKWWLISGAPRFNDDGVQIGSIGIHLDITDQKKLQTELIEEKERADQSVVARDSFIANMSHEIRTPMNAIIGLGSLMAKTTLNSVQATYLNHINNSAKNLLVILNDVLDFSKLEAGKLSIEKISFNLKEAIDKSVNILGFKAEEKGIALFNNYDSRIASWFLGDPSRLNQIMMNLLSNAIKFTSEGSISIQCSLIRSENNKQVVRLMVSDTGIGMEPEFLDKIFEKFTQEDQRVSKHYGGTGLGMTITRELVKLMEGKLQISSQKGSGTTVSVEFAFEQTSEPEQLKTINQAIEIPALKGKKILLVEDNPTNRIVANSMLQPYGVEVKEAENGYLALEILRSYVPDLILMDIQMPGIDGLETTVRIRQEFGNAIPVLALTANVLLPMQLKCKESGMNDFLAKPFEEEDLVGKIAGLLNIQAIPVVSKTSSDLPEQSNLLSTDLPLYDLSKLEKLSRGDQDFLNHMLSIFIKEVPITLAKLKQALVEENFADMKAYAHRLKPSIKDMGVQSLKDILPETEQAAEEHNLELLKKHIPFIGQTVELVIDQLSSRSNKN